MRALLLLLDSPGCAHPSRFPARPRLEETPTLDRLFHAEPDLWLPTLDALGWWKIVTGDVLAPRAQGTRARWGRLRPQAAHRVPTALLWELVGVIRAQPFVSPAEVPAEWLAALQKLAGVAVAEIPTLHGFSDWLAALGPRPAPTAPLLVGMEPGSTLHLVAHGELLAPAALQLLARKARALADVWGLARLVVHPLQGAAGKWRPDGPATVLPMVPPRTILNALAERGLTVRALGGLGQHFGGSGVTTTATAEPTATPAQINAAWREIGDGLILAALPNSAAANDLHGTGAWLGQVDAWLETFLAAQEQDDLVIIVGAPWTTALPEEVELPISVVCRGEAGPVGTRRRMSDVAATLAEFFKLRAPWPEAESLFRAPVIQRTLTPAPRMSAVE